MNNFTKIYELTRRNAQRFYYESWKSMKKYLKDHSFKNSPLMREQYIETMARYERIREKDGFDILRYSMTQELSKFLQKQIEISQNPQKCDDARILVSLL